MIFCIYLISIVYIKMLFCKCRKVLRGIKINFCIYKIGREYIKASFCIFPAAAAQNFYPTAARKHRLQVFSAFPLCENTSCIRLQLNRLLKAVAAGCYNAIAFRKRPLQSAANRQPCEKVGGGKLRLFGSANGVAANG